MTSFYAKYSHKTISYLFLRLSLGIILVFYGLGKLLAGPTVFANRLVGQFANTPLPAGLVRLFGTLLPFAEFGLGLLITLGVFTFFGLTLAALLLIALSFGMVILQQPQTV
ncbi:MAG: MauE/DoxX family redox-associated membrane protein, partial [Acidobacteriota bacterium]